MTSFRSGRVSRTAGPDASGCRTTGRHLGAIPVLRVTLPDLALWILLSAGGVVVSFLTLRAIWFAVGRYRISRAGPRPLSASRARIWQPPDQRNRLNLVGQPSGADDPPSPPFMFLEEHAQGSQPCVSLRDARGRRWRVKWGDEVRSESFAVRFAQACGYFAPPTYFVPAGHIEGAAHLQRARSCVHDTDGSFVDGRFQLDDPSVKKLFEEHSWSWDDNPFVGTPELSGLKIVAMLLSNWDTKDRRDVARGSNTAIFEHPVARRRREARYVLSDWGGSMGKWGANIVTRGRWDVDGFESQTPGFVTGVKDGRVSFGYAGQRTADVAGDIPLEHARWFCEHASTLTDRLLVQALLASGATQDEAERFARSLLERIHQLQAVVTSTAGQP